VHSGDQSASPTSELITVVDWRALKKSKGERMAFVKVMTADALYAYRAWRGRERPVDQKPVTEGLTRVKGAPPAL
jgi:hypothetical protein